VIDALPAPQRLALGYAAARSRAATLALLLLDARLAAVLRGRREPLATQLRLAWWRDVLAKPKDEWPLGEPLLEALRRWRDPAALASLPAAWEALLAEDLSVEAIAGFADGRALGFAALARELEIHEVEQAADAARIWALADLAANLTDSAERTRVVEHARSFARPARLPRPLRPLAVLAGLGAAALARGGGDLLTGPSGMLLALRIGVTGR
jgi:phytoene synthase